MSQLPGCSLVTMRICTGGTTPARHLSCRHLQGAAHAADPIGFFRFPAPCLRSTQDYYISGRNQCSTNAYVKKISIRPRFSQVPELESLPRDCISILAESWREMRSGEPSVDDPAHAAHRILARARRASSRRGYCRRMAAKNSAFVFVALSRSIRNSIAATSSMGARSFRRIQAF